MMPARCSLRRARPDEAAAISALMFRSKASWGYDDAFMEATRKDLAIAPAMIRSRPVFVAELDGALAGVAHLRIEGEEAILVDLFVAPEAMGAGIGRALWNEAVTMARNAGCRRMSWQSDPYAEGFYRRMGGEVVGYSESTVIPGRRLPEMAISLAGAIRPD